MGREPDSIIGDRAFNCLRHGFQPRDDKDTREIISDRRQNLRCLAALGTRSRGRIWSVLQ